MAINIQVYPNFSPRIIEVLAPTESVTVQELIDSIRAWEDSPIGANYPFLIDAAGKEDLGGGVKVGITATLQNAQIAFSGRTTPLDDGAGRTCDLTDPKGERLYVDDADFVTDGVYPGCTVLNDTTKELAAVTEVIDANNLDMFSLSGQGDLGWTVGDSYLVWPNVQCSITGGNLVAVDDTGDSISPVLQTPNVQIVRSSSSSATLQELTAIQHSSFDGGITIDLYNITGKAAAGTTFPTGTNEQPSNNWDDAHTIAEERGFTTFYVIGDMVIDSGVPPFDGHVFVGESPSKSMFTIDDAANVFRCEFLQATLQGTLDGESQVQSCIIETLNYVNGIVYNSIINDTIALGGGEVAHFINCQSGVPGSSTPTIDCGGSGQPLALRNYNGGIRLINKTGPESASLDINSGQVILESSVTAGEIVIRGIGKLTDNSNGANVDAENFINDQMIANSVWDEPLTGATHNIPTSAGRRLRALASAIVTEGIAVSAALNSIVLNGDASTEDGAYGPAIIAIVGGTGYGQCRMIVQYDGTTKRAWLDRDWKTIPDATSEYTITANAGREHVNEGVAQGGGANTITLNALASPNDGAYEGQVVFIRSGTGEDQACRILAYNGTTKVATICKDWAVQPDNTSVYIMLPTATLTRQAIAGSVWNALTADYGDIGSFGKAIADILNAGGSLTPTQATQLEELYKLQGLQLGKPMRVTPSQRTVDDIELELTGDGETETIVTRK